MINLRSLIVDYLEHKERFSYRDRQGHYASQALTCLRDQYWALTGMPETNPPDEKGRFVMMVGDAIESYLCKEVIAKLHRQGVQVLGTQVAVGGSNPSWAGYLDAFLECNEGGAWKRYVMEHKIKNGIGANIFYDRFNVSPDHLVQLGLYLKDLHEKGVTNEGFLYYSLLSDDHYGDSIQVNCRYNPNTVGVEAYEAIWNGKEHRNLDQGENIQRILDRWVVLEQHVARKEEPPPDYVYKYRLTQELIAGISDAKLRKCINRELIMGDWQCKYSRYKDLALQRDNIVTDYSPEEIGLLRAEYLKRHPRSKI